MENEKQGHDDGVENKKKNFLNNKNRWRGAGVIGLVSSSDGRMAPLTNHLFKV